MTPSREHSTIRLRTPDSIDRGLHADGALVTLLGGVHLHSFQRECGFKAFSTHFRGTIPDPMGQFFTNEFTCLRYGQCSEGELFTNL